MARITMVCRHVRRMDTVTVLRRAYLPLCAGIMAAALVPGAGTAWAQDGASTAPKPQAGAHTVAQTRAELAQQVEKARKEQAATAARRERAARRKLEQQQELMRQAVARRDAVKAHAEALAQQWKDNTAQIAKQSELLTQREGDVGELFGVLRVVASKAAKDLRGSLLSTQFRPQPGQEQRSLFLQQLAQTKSLPSLDKLRRLWFELLREIVGEGQVVRYRTDVLQLYHGKPTGTSKPMNVVRVGPFTAVSGDQYLGYLSTADSLTQLDGVLPSGFRHTAYHLTHAAPGSGYTSAVVDAARGGLLHRYLQRPGWLQRVQLGQTVGYVIIAIAIIGLLVALFQYAYLMKTRLAVNAQLRDLSRPKPDNPLGRLLLTVRGDNKRPQRTDVAALHLHEAIQKEMPSLERYQSFLRLAVAAGPLLGLVGTVTGMIITFHAIVASGGGDPTVMATGIGHAMIATVLGLGCAIPLLFLNMGLRAFSGSITQVLDEFSNSLLAEQMKGDKGHGARELLGGEGDPYRASE